MDRVNNAIAIDIARKVRAKFVGNPSVTEQQVKDEIAREANEAIVSGKATFYITRDNDHDYTPPSGVLDPANDVGEGESHFPVGGGASNDNSAPASAGSSGGLLSSITDFFSSTADRIGGALGLGGGRSGAALALNGRFGFQRVGLDPGSLERLLSQGIDKFTDKVAERLVKNDGVLNNALGRTLTQNTGVFGDLLRKGRMGELGGALEDVFSAGNIGKVIGDFAGNAINAGFNKLVGAGKVKTTVTSQESERSREAQSRWNPSRSQQAAELARVVNMGTRNL